MDEVNGKLEEIMAFVRSVFSGGVAVSVEWASSQYIHRRFGINHMALRSLAKGGEVRAKKLADGESIPVSKSANVVYRVKDVEEWMNIKAVAPDWVVQKEVV